MFQITKKSVLTLMASSVVVSSLWAHDVTSKADKIDFIENKGQWVAEAKYRADIPGGSMFLSDKGFVYNFASQKDMEAIYKMTCEGGTDVPEDYKINVHSYKVSFVGANPNVSYTSSDKRSYYHNYFIGNEQSKWASKVGLYGSVKQSNIYNGVDLVVYSNNSQSVKYDFVVAAGADASVIKLAFEGVTPKLTSKGDLEIKTSVNTIQEKAPVTYQMIDGQKVSVKSKYVLTNGMLSFAFPEGYNKAYDLVVDPDLVFATYSGGTGSNANFAHSTTYDNDGNTYAAALINSATINWPVTVGAYQVTISTSSSVGINKYSASGSNLIYSTYFGTTNSQNPTPSTLRVNDLGELFMAGTVGSSTLPTTTGAFQMTLNGGADLYIARFSQDGSSLLACTYVGGSGTEGSIMGATGTYSGNNTASPTINPTDLTFDASGNVWVTGNSGSTNFPVTSNAMQATNAGSHDVVMFKMPPDLTSMIYSTYIGGSGWDGGIGIEYNANNNTIGLVGVSRSSNFPTSVGAYNVAALGGTNDGFVTLLDNSNYNRIATSLLGSSGDDYATRIAFDCGDNVYVAGRTNGNYPITVSANYTNPNGSVFIDKLNPSLSSSIAAIRTGIANNTSLLPSAMMVDICGNILLATLTYANVQPNMPLTDDAFGRTPTPFYFAAYEPNFTGLVFGSYFGATGSDHFHPGVARIDPQGIIYHSVCYAGVSGNWPTTPNSYSPNKMNGSTNDIVTFKFNFEAFAVKVVGETPEGGNVPNNHAIRGCKSAFLHYSRSIKDTIPMTIRLEILGDAINGQDYTFLADSVVIPANDSTVSLEIEALLAPRATGTRRVIINTFAPCACDGNTDNLMSSDTVLIIDSVYVNMPRKSGYSCPGDTVTITAQIDPTLGYYWAPANLIPNTNGLTIKPAPVATTNYSITVRQIGAPATCPSRTATYTAYVEPYPIISVPDYHPTICLADSFDLSMQVRPNNPGYIYQWSPGTYLRETNKANTKFYAPVGNYKLYMRASTPNAKCSSTDSMQITVVPPFQFTGITPKDTTVQYGESVAIEAFGDAIMWSWSPVDYLNDPMLKRVISTPETNTKYTLIGWDKFGCKDTIDMTVRVKHVPNLFIPNAFTPNNDGLNDVFKISNIVHEKLISFSVFNKLGQEVFHTIDPNNGWDGTFKNGKDAPVDVYFYLIKISSPLSENGVYEYKGDVTLLR